MVGPAALESSALQTTIGNIANGLLGSGTGFQESVIDQALGLVSEYVGPDIANGIANALFNGGADPYANGMPSIQDLAGSVGGLFEGAFQSDSPVSAALGLAGDLSGSVVGLSGNIMGAVGSLAAGLADSGFTAASSMLSSI